ncbi:MAG: hypothetical protein QW091_02660 [Candidatus Micrarchaeaceae archaeon]
MRGRLAYKKSEAEALSKLVSLNENYKSIGKLKHMKEVLEFKISTEARTLDEERTLLKKLGDLEAQLKDAIASQRLRGKARLVDEDIAELKKKEEELSNDIANTNTRIDELKLRLGAATRPRHEHRRHEPSVATPLTVSIQDIAIIKTKKGKQTNGNANAMSSADENNQANTK